MSEPVEDHESPPRGPADAEYDTSAEGERPVLGYSSPQTNATDPNARRNAIQSGFYSVWAMLVMVLAMGCGARNAVWLLTLLALGCASLIYIAIQDSRTHQHRGYFLGLLLGLLSFVGAAATLIVAVCGKWR